MTTRSRRKPKRLSKAIRSKRYSLKAQRSKRSLRKNAGKKEINRRKIAPQRTSKKTILTDRLRQNFPGKLRSSLRVSAKRAGRMPSNRGLPARRRGARVPDALNFISGTLDHEWIGYLKRLQEFRHKASVKNVHDLRVSIRRLMTCVELVERFNPDNVVRRARITLKEQLSELSNLRDIHVEMVAIRGYLKQLPEIKQFYDRLRERESDHLSAAKKMSSNTKFIENAINRAQVRLAARRATIAVSAASKIVNDAVDRSFDNVNGKLEYATIADYSTIHSVRIAFKPFRYLLEMLQPLVPIERKQLRAAQSLARMMGKIQDIEVLMKSLVEFKWKQDGARRAVIEIWLDLERRKTDVAQRFLRSIPKFGNIWKPILHDSTISKTADSKTLYALRHGIAVARGDLGYPLDSDRPLTLKGMKRMRIIARGMRGLGVRFDVILTSPYRRALETAFVVGREYRLGESIQTTAALKPEVLPEEVIRSLQDKYSSCRNLLLVGHDPQLSALVSTLTSGSAGARPLLKKGGLCKLQVEKLQLGKCATLLWLLTPKQLISMT
ncbi:MAG: CHAD domain-containing protein [Candidatus Bathyarchaeia archaeon]